MRGGGGEGLFAFTHLDPRHLMVLVLIAPFGGKGKTKDELEDKERTFPRTTLTNTVLPSLDHFSWKTPL